MSCNSTTEFRGTFLLRGVADVRAAYSRLGHRVRREPDLRALYRDLADWLQTMNAAARHHQWQREYDRVLRAALLTSAKADKRTRFQAHLRAQAAVAAKFDVTTQTVRKALK